MVTEQERVLKFDIEDAPPELDFVFALLRNTHLMFDLRVKGVTKGMEVYIDGISVNKNDLKERYNLVIQGRFWGDGVKSWSNFQYAMDEQKGLEYWYTLWGEFEATYNKRTRKGVLITKNFKAQEIHHI